MIMSDFIQDHEDGLIQDHPGWLPSRRPCRPALRNCFTLAWEQIHAKIKPSSTDKLFQLVGKVLIVPKNLLLGCPGLLSVASSGRRVRYTIASIVQVASSVAISLMSSVATSRSLASFCPRPSAFGRQRRALYPSRVLGYRHLA